MKFERKRVAKRLASGLLAGALALGGLAISGGTASATSVVTTTTRVAGADRYGTAIKLAGAAANPKVVLVNGENFADGLSASTLAGVLGAKLLLTPAASLPDSVLAAIVASLGTADAADAVVIVGGTSSVSAGIQSQLAALGYPVYRFGGADRYATADAVAAAAVTNSGGAAPAAFGGYKTAILANGNNFADALAISGWAYSMKHPIFLTNGTSLSAGTKAAIVAAGVQQVLILGGTAAVSDAVKSEAAGLAGVITTTRIGGADRYETATLLATALSAVDADFKAKAFLVNGTNFPDALAVSQYAGHAGAIIPVTSPMPAKVAAWFTANSATMATIEAIGGTSAVSDETWAATKAASTLAGLTATISALDGATTAAVVLSDNVDAATVSAAGADFVVTSALGAAKAVTAVYAAKTLTTPATIVLTLGAGVFAPGDKISLAAASISAPLDATRFVAPTSFTVVPDTSAASATMVAYPGAASATAKVWVTLSANTLASSFDTTGDSADLVVTKGSGAIGATPAVITNCTQVGTTLTYACDLTAAAALVAGDVVTMPAASIVSGASTGVPNAAVSAVVAADAVAPVLQSVRYSQTGTGGAKAAYTYAGTGSVTVQARSAGVAGNTHSVTRAVGAIACAYSAATKTVTITAQTTSDAVDVANACAANADVAAAYAVTATAGTLDAGWTAGTSALSGGTDVISLKLTFSEPLSAAVAGNFTLSGTAITGASALALTADAATDAGRLTGVLTLTFTATGSPLAGLSSLTVGAGVTDRAGNAVSVAVPPATHIVAMYPAA